MSKTLRMLVQMMAVIMLFSLLPVAALAEAPMVIEWYYDDTNPPVENDWFLKEVEEAFNVTLKPILRPGPEQKQWYDMELSAGTEFDYYQSGGLMRSDYYRYVDGDLVLELDKAMIAENMPNYMKWAEKYADSTFGGDLFKWWEVDGKLYTLPTSRPGDAHRNVLGIRQDWLDNLNLDPPTTIEEFEAVLKAFTQDDPDGNGVDDTYGITGVNWRSYTMAPYMQAFGTNIDLWYENDGVVKYGTVQPETKEALALMNRWYMAGYIAPNTFEQDWEAFRSDLYNSRAGMGVQYYMVFMGLTEDWLMADLLAATAGASYTIVPGITGPNGDVGCQQFSPIVYSGVMFSYRMADQPEKLAKYMQIFDALTFDEQWQLKANYGIEGVDYNMDADGLPVRLASDENREESKPSAGMVLGNMTPFFNDPDQDRVYRFRTLEERAADEFGFAMATGIYNLMDASPVPREKGNLYGDALNEIVDAYILPIIKGERPIDDFDRMVEEWKAAGGDEVVAEAQEIYDTYMK